MSTLAVILWILVAVLFIAAVYGVYRACRQTLRKLAGLGDELSGLADDFAKSSTLAVEARASARQKEVDHG